MVRKKPTEEKKIYTSFHDIPPREYMYFPKGTVEVSRPGKFSRIEINQLIISIIVLTIAFSFALTPFNLRLGFDFERLPIGFFISLLAIVTAFFFHEMSHKFMAQKYGLWAEYRMFPQGLILSFIIGLLTGFVFAAPGAVMFQGGSRSFETGKIAAAGPLANIVLTLITLPLYLFVFFETNIIGDIFWFISYINIFLAIFNLLPFGPLDGTKIIRWNATMWILLLILSITLFAVIISNTPLALF